MCQCKIEQKYPIIIRDKEKQMYCELSVNLSENGWDDIGFTSIDG